MQVNMLSLEKIALLGPHENRGVKIFKNQNNWKVQQKVYMRKTNYFERFVMVV